MTDTNKEHPPPNEKAALAGGDLEANNVRHLFTHKTGKSKWKRDLEWALDAVLEADCGDLGLIERNLVEAATSMLEVASEIRRELRQ
jgi:hypothetical protein